MRQRDGDHHLAGRDGQDEGVGGERHDALDELAHRLPGRCPRMTEGLQTRCLRVPRSRETQARLVENQGAVPCRVIEALVFPDCRGARAGSFSLASSLEGRSSTA